VRRPGTHSPHNASAEHGAAETVTCRRRRHARRDRSAGAAGLPILALALLHTVVFYPGTRLEGLGLTDPLVLAAAAALLALLGGQRIMRRAGA
jgi:hypothetical protein